MKKVISVFIKEIGSLKRENEQIHGSQKIVTFLFSYKENTEVKIIIMETNPNSWVIHHELSHENPFLLKKIIQAVEKLNAENEKMTYLLSEELTIIKREFFFKTAIKCMLQNTANKHFVLFADKKK